MYLPWYQLTLYHFLPARASEQGNVIGSVRICNSYTMGSRGISE